VFGAAPVADDDALVAMLPARMELRGESGVRLTRVVVAGAPSVVLSWHHGLMDARTAERLLQRLGGADPGGREAVSAPVGLGERLKRAWRARNAVYASSMGPIAWTLPVPAGSGPVDRLRRVRIGGEELAAVDAATQAAGAGMFRGTYHIAVTARVPATVAEGCLQMLRDANLLAAETRTGGHKPAQPLEAMTVGALWTVVDSHSAGTAGEPDLTSDPAAKELGLIEADLMATAASKLTLGELAGRS
jgi:hypothetical protein